MLGRLTLVLLTLLTAPLTGCLGDGTTLGAQSTPPPVAIPQDAVVVAVVDSGINPYHLDWLLAEMPQNLDDDDANDVAFDASPEEWLPGFEAPTGGVHALPLTLPAAASDEVEPLREQDKEAIDGVQKSTADAVHLYYVPGTKIVGLVDFAGNGAVASANAHGARAASVAVGNVYGACPECLLVFVNNGGGEDAFEWAISQDWIDVVTNSWGYGSVYLPVNAAGTNGRDRIYSGSDLELSREVSERGQTIFFSAGNGLRNDFILPNPTLFSSQEGPDWMITVGAIAPDGRGSYTGHGKPADIASFGSQYPSQGGDTADGEGTFGGTSSATPTIAGTYARALWWARQQLSGESRAQIDGVIARGDPIACGAAYAECELGDGILTAKELRMRLLHGAVHTPIGTTVMDVANAPAVGEEEFLSEGHGAYFGRMDGDAAWEEELTRITAPMVGAAAPLARPDGEADWFTVDSWCRQSIWASWSDGYYLDGETTLPGPDPMWPVRTATLQACPHLFPPMR